MVLLCSCYDISIIVLIITKERIEMSHGIDRQWPALCTVPGSSPLCQHGLLAGRWSLVGLHTRLEDHSPHAGGLNTLAVNHLKVLFVCSQVTQVL